MAQHDSPAGLERATWWEIGGAWLHLWTPPRDVEVPDPPMRRIALIAAAILVVCAGGLALIIPALDRSKAATARRNAAREAAARRTEYARLVHDQRLIRGRADLGDAAGTPAAAAVLTAAISRAVAAEARRRHATGELESPIIGGPARCRPRESSTATRLRLECLATTSYVDRGDGGPRAGSIGYPFLAAGSPATGRFGLCKSNPPPGEKAALSTNATQPDPPAACVR